MNTKALHLIYGLALLIILPIVAYMFLTNRNVGSENKKQFERIDTVEGKLIQLETLNKMLQKEVEDTASKQKEASGSVELSKKDEGVKSPDKSTIRINVLNGRGLAGVAGKVQTKLEAAGYSVQNVDNTTWQADSTINARVGFEKAVEDLRTVLKGEYTFTQVNNLAADEKDYDIILIIGQN